MEKMATVSLFAASVKETVVVHTLRLLIGCFMLVGSAMFGGFFNLVTRVGLQ